MSGRQQTTARLPELPWQELSPATWLDFERLFQRHGGVWGGCWCMYYHFARRHDWAALTPRQRKAQKKFLVNQDCAHGVLVYHDGHAVGWCQFGPRGELPRIDHLRNYRLMGPDDTWRITCFFIDKRYRRRGIAKQTLRAALAAMKQRGVKTVEAYPIHVRRRYSSALLWFGTLNLFQEFGFRTVGRLGKHQLIMQKRL